MTDCTSRRRLRRPGLTQSIRLHVDQPAQRLRPDDEHVAGATRAHELVGHGEHVEEARALVADAHRRHAAEPEMAREHGIAMPVTGLVAQLAAKVYGVYDDRLR